MLAKTESDLLVQECSRLLAYAGGHHNDETYACMLASWQAGDGVMPDDFGLGKDDFSRLLGEHFPGLKKSSLTIPARNNDAERDDERDDVFQLLQKHCAGLHESETWMAKIVAMACQGQDHLWQDLGLWSRQQLSELMLRNFPELALKNDKNMKWKKFLYKQLCQTEGIYTCRAPSCEVCSDYQNCFGPEE